jgi:hypothetical protein
MRRDSAGDEVVEEEKTGARVAGPNERERHTQGERGRRGAGAVDERRLRGGEREVRKRRRARATSAWWSTNWAREEAATRMRSHALAIGGARGDKPADRGAFDVCGEGEGKSEDEGLCGKGTGRKEMS